ncbi:hypothetical protein [Halorhodospira halochloris]|uniref:hypothetical protein n=1 Tax=Halorhodospira halochloris TaxID=1052 RepID=UPI001EE96CC1|nr:hypothetical protein [Halorhodospira halochloris]MCG5547246.1 hypothetical protein [Halorhodospira halochloris]
MKYAHYIKPYSSVLAIMLGVGSLMLSGCEGDDGDDGEDGATADEVIDRMEEENRLDELRGEDGSDGAGAVNFNLLAVETQQHLETARKAQSIEYGDWERVVAFYPNQANRQWLSSVQDGSGYHEDASDGGHGGSSSFEEERACLDCHNVPGSGGFNHPWQMGVDLVDADVDGFYYKDNTRDIRARAAFDSERLYLHVQWFSDTDAGGQGDYEHGPTIAHQTYRWDGDQFTDGGDGRIAEPGADDIESVADPGENAGLTTRNALRS